MGLDYEEGADEMTLPYIPPSQNMLDLLALIEESKRLTDAMTPAEREAMYTQQRNGYAKAGASWPKPVYEWVNGVKVYASYADYCA